MLVVTCVKQVPDTTQVKTDPKTGTLIREGVPFIMNPFDAHALEDYSVFSPSRGNIHIELMRFA